MRNGEEKIYLKSIYQGKKLIWFFICEYICNLLKVKQEEI